MEMSAVVFAELAVTVTTIYPKLNGSHCSSSRNELVSKVFVLDFVVDACATHFCGLPFATAETKHIGKKSVCWYETYIFLV